MFVTLAVLLTLDGALEYEKPECAHDNVTFCNLLTSIHKHNEKMAQCGRPAGAPHSINICPICRRGSAPSVLKPNSTLPDGILLKIYVVRRTIVTLVALLRTRLLSLVFQLDLVQSIRAASLRSTSRLLVANPVAGYLLSTKSPPNSVRVVTSPNHGRSINGRLPKAFVDALDEIRQEMVQLRKECKELRQENRALREDNLRMEPWRTQRQNVSYRMLRCAPFWAGYTSRTRSLKLAWQERFQCRISKKQYRLLIKQFLKL
ncbi:hypothetical protein Q1695_004370 [Nippostrongylus brasiliensis]|nr:hypothetical protein Q1695_004370 [Nippostrongylus brasiliensis]